MNEMSFNQVVESYKDQFLASRQDRSNFQHTFLSIIVEKYKNDFTSILNADKLSLNCLENVNMLNSSECLPQLYLVLKYIWETINKRLERNASDRNWANNITNWFPLIDSTPGKVKDSQGITPSRESVYQISLILDWNLKDCNRLFSSLSLQKSGFCGSMADNIYHYSLKFKKGFDWAISTIETLENKKVELPRNFEKHYATAAELSIKINNTFIKALNIENADDFDEKQTTSTEIQDADFIKKMEELLLDFNYNSGVLLSVFRAISSAEIRITCNMFASLFPRSWGITADYANKLLSDITPRGVVKNGFLTKKKIADTKNVPTREFLILYSITRYCYDDELRHRKTSLSSYINENLNTSQFSLLDKAKRFDSFVLELSNFSIDDSSNVYYKSQKINYNFTADDSIFHTKKLKPYQTAHIYNSIMSKYDDCLNIGIFFNSVELVSKALRISYS